MDNPEKLATLGTQDTGRRQTKQKTNPYTQANTNNVNEPSCNQLEINTKRTSFLSKNHNGHENTELHF